MNSRQLQYVLALSRTCNFSSAAEELSISQPALSKQIIALEKELGVKLFERATTPLTLTPAGEFFVQKAQKLLFEEDQLRKTMRSYKDGACGKLCIGISPFRSLYLMPPIVKALRTRFPGVTLALAEHGREQLHKGIYEGLYDFAITNLPVDEARLHALPLEKDTLVLAIPDAMLPLLKKEKPAENATIPLADLQACAVLPFIVLSREQELRRLFDKLCLLSKLDAHICMEVVGIATAWAMVQAGIGATILPRQFILPFPNPQVSIFELVQDSYVRQPAIVTRRGQFLTEYAQYAIELLQCNSRLCD